MPRSDSARLRGQSQMDFKTATTGVAAKAMRNEISGLVKTVSDPSTRKVRRVDATAADRAHIDRRHSTPRCSPSSTSLRATSQSVPTPRRCASPRVCVRPLLTRRSEWDRIKSPGDDKIVPYSKLPAGDPSTLNKLAVLKVNGGLGTSMGESPFPLPGEDRKSTRLNSSHSGESRMPSSA